MIQFCKQATDLEPLPNGRLLLQMRRLAGAQRFVNNKARLRWVAQNG